MKETDESPVRVLVLVDSEFTEKMSWQFGRIDMLKLGKLIAGEDTLAETVVFVSIPYNDRGESLRHRFAYTLDCSGITVRKCRADLGPEFKEFSTIAASMAQMILDRDQKETFDTLVLVSNKVELAPILNLLEDDGMEIELAGNPKTLPGALRGDNRQVFDLTDPNIQEQICLPQAA